MGYRDDFYIGANIIGYTGDLNNGPTVYFQTAAEYGRITQTHGFQQNIGRGQVHDIAGYTMANENIGGVMTLVERMNGQVTHQSRNAFQPVTPQNIDILIRSIVQFTGEKYISNFPRTLQRQIIRTEQARANVLAELLQVRPRQN
jgi:hypothetical protein